MVFAVAGCSFLEDPPPYRVLNPGMDSDVVEDAAPRLDFAVRTNDAFVPSGPPTRRPDMMAPEFEDQGVMIPVDVGVPAGDSGVVVEGVPKCLDACVESTDCDEGSTCDEGVCIRGEDADLCASADGCVAALSNWSNPCTAFEDCPIAHACVRIDDLGRCAPMIGDMSDSSGCEQPDHSALVRRDFVTNGELTVCGQARAVCLDAVCTLACRSDEDCSADVQYPLCDQMTGRCVCGDESCQTNASLCTGEGRCACVNDADCTTGGLDRCYEGECGCSSDQGCSDGAVNPGSYRCVVR